MVLYMRFLYNYNAAFINYIASTLRHVFEAGSDKIPNAIGGAAMVASCLGPTFRPPDDRRTRQLPRPPAGPPERGGATGKRGCDTNLLGIASVGISRRRSFKPDTDNRRGPPCSAPHSLSPSSSALLFARRGHSRIRASSHLRAAAT